MASRDKEIKETHTGVAREAIAIAGRVYECTIDDLHIHDIPEIALRLVEPNGDFLFVHSLRPVVYRHDSIYRLCQSYEVWEPEISLHRPARIRCAILPPSIQSEDIEIINYILRHRPAGRCTGPIGDIARNLCRDARHFVDLAERFEGTRRNAGPAFLRKLLGPDALSARSAARAVDETGLSAYRRVQKKWNLEAGKKGWATLDEMLGCVPAGKRPMALARLEERMDNHESLAEIWADFERRTKWHPRRRK